MFEIPKGRRVKIAETTGTSKTSGIVDNISSRFLFFTNFVHTSAESRKNKRKRAHNQPTFAKKKEKKSRRGIKLRSDLREIGTALFALRQFNMEMHEFKIMSHSLLGLEATARKWITLLVKESHNNFWIFILRKKMVFLNLLAFCVSTPSFYYFKRLYAHDWPLYYLKIRQVTFYRENLFNEEKYWKKCSKLRRQCVLNRSMSWFCVFGVFRTFCYDFSFELQR